MKFFVVIVAVIFLKSFVTIILSWILQKDTRAGDGGYSTQEAGFK